MTKRLTSFLREHWIMLLILVAIIALPWVIGWLTGSNPLPPRPRRAGESVAWQAIFIQIYIFAILAMSYNVMFGFTGVISFGHAAFFGMGGYMLGIGVARLNMDFGVAVILSLVVSALLGLIVGLVSLRIKGVYFAIFTLAFAQVFFILARNRLLVDITGAEDGFFFNVPDYIYGGTATTRLQLYYITVVILVLVYVFIRRLVNSPTGRVFQAIRENESRAKTLGYNTLRYKLLAIIVAGMLASVAGMLHVILNNRQPLPEFLGAVYTVDPLLATLLGGVGTFVGPALGSTVLHLGEEVLRSSDVMIFGNEIGDYWLLALGIAFIVIVLVFPKGIVGTFNDWRIKRRGTIGRSQIRASPVSTAPESSSGEGD